jgi:hypothetical protein
MEGGTLLNPFHEGSINLTPEPKTLQEKITNQVSVNVDLKSSTKRKKLNAKTLTMIIHQGLVELF